MHNRPCSTVFRAALLLCLAAAPAVRAESTVAPGFALTRFEPSERGSRWFNLESLDWQEGRTPELGLVLDYAYKPLVLYRTLATGQQEVVTIGRHFGVAHLGGAYVFAGSFRVAADLPVVAYGDGFSGQLGLVTYQPPARSGLGDLRLSADWRFHGRATDPFRADLGVSLYVPTGDPLAYAGDGMVRGRVQLQVAGEVSGTLAYTARLGVHLRREALYAGSSVGSELQLGAAAGWKGFDGRLVVGPELTASSAFSQFFQGGATSVELLLGAHLDLTRQWRLGAGVGRGLTVALGSPTVRGVLSLEWTPDLDPDGSCAASKEQLQALVAARATAEREAEARAAVEARAAAERLAAEKALAEKAAAERAAAEEAAARARADDDGDGIPNAEDACPTEAGPRSENASRSGCPAGALANGQIVLDQVQFKFASDVILPASFPNLEKALAGLQKLPAARRVRVEGHTDGLGHPAYNKDLSERRAKSVVAWLVAHGQDAKRFDAQGFGSERPVAANDTEEHQQLNRRVELHLIDLEAR